MDFPLTDLLDEGACYQRLLSWLHPGGLRCPNGCRAAGDCPVHRGRRAPVLDYRCRLCGRVFNLFTGTALQGTQRPCAQILLLVRGIAQGVPTARLARELGCDYKHLLELRHRLQGLAERAAGRQLPLADSEVEADELYQNAGEKRPPPHRPGRPAAPPGQQAARPRELGRRPAAGGGRGRA
jgi:transposase-like protein